MEHALFVIERHCQKNQIQPIELLGYLLEILQHNHVMQGTAGGFAQDANNRANAFNEVLGICNLLGKPDQVPASLLATLDLPLRAQELLDTANADNCRKKNANSKEVAALEHRALVIKTFRLIIRDLTNQADTQGLDHRMKLEDIAKKEGWKLPDTPPTEDESE
jgi:hypothetical protein